MLNKKITLLQQVEMIELHESLDLTGLHAGLPMDKILDNLLPNYDQDYNPKHRAFHAANQRTKVRKGGVRSGKTYSFGAEAIGLSFLNRPYTHLSLSPTFPNACETVGEVLMELCDQNKRRHHFYRDRGKFEIYWGTRKSDTRETAQILLKGADQFYKGITAASGDCNESFSIPKTAFTYWWERISKHVAVFRRLFGSTAEPDTMQWGWEYFKEKLTIRPDLYADTLTTYDNRKYLPEGYIEDLEGRYDSRMRRVYMLGECINLSAGKVYYMFDNEKHKKPAHDIHDFIKNERRVEIILGFDFNVGNMSCTEWVVKQNELRCAQVDEYILSSSNTSELANLVCHRLKEKYPGIEQSRDRYSLLITGDASGRKRTTTGGIGMTDYTIIREVFQNAGFMPTIAVPETNPLVRDRVNDVNKMFEDGCIWVFDNCSRSLDDRELVLWKKGAEKFEIDKSNNERTHASDAGDYALMIIKAILQRRRFYTAGSGMVNLYGGGSRYDD